MNQQEIAQALYTKGLKRMIESCYTYGGADKTTDNYTTYILPYQKKLGEELFNNVYEQHLKFLQDNAVVEPNVFKDPEGSSYSSLTFK